MKVNKLLFFIFGICIFSSCGKTDQEKLDKILKSEELTIQQNTFGGIAGYSEQVFNLKNGEYESLLIIDKGTDYQTFVRMDEKEELLKTFIIKAYESSNLDKEMSNSCVTGIDTEYILKSGLTTLVLRPNKKCDSLFNAIVYE
ncbi:MAG: hypothetical protein JXQ87_17830 [Bacteroidia bacterium]